MTRIVVFDSGLGSLSIIKAIQQEMKCDIIYFADQKNFPYGKKSVKTLKKIILNSINKLQERFSPDIIVVASNTPSILLQEIFSNNKSIIGVLPPLQHAKKISKQTICVLATKSVVFSKTYQEFIHSNSSNKKIISINASPLIELVESGKIFSQKNFCKKIINNTLSKQFSLHNVDVVTLSSTHLPFLLPLLQELYPKISFIDPAKLIAKQISKKLTDNDLTRNKLQVYTSGNPYELQKILFNLHKKNKVHKIKF